MTDIKWLLFSLCLSLSTMASAQDSYVPMQDVESFRQQLDKMANAVQTIESDFIQEKHLSVLSNEIISKGSFCFRKENNIRWEYTGPYQYLIIISGEKIFLKDESGQQQYDMESNKMFQEMNRFISGCIQGDILKDEADYRTEYLENEQEYFVILEPNSRALHDMLNEVQIAFDRDDLTVNRITMLEPGGDYTRIDFVNKVLNTDIPLEKFSFR